MYLKHHAFMKFMEQLQTDLKQAVVQHQHQLLLEVLQRRSQELTLGDLRKLLASPLGRGLDDVRLALLFGAVATPKSLPVAEAKPKQARVHKPQDKPAAAKPKAAAKQKTAAKPKAAADQRSNPSQELVEAVAAVLQSAKKPLSTPEIGAKLDVHRTTVRGALHKLDAQKRVTISGKGKFTRYASKSAQPATASEATPPTKSRKRRGKAKKASQVATNQPAATSQPAQTSKGRKRAGKAKKAAQAVAKQGPTDDQSYDTAVLACLREKGSAASSEILAVVGGTIDRLRVALIRLAATGQLVRTGERKLTRYSLKSPG